MTDFNSFELNNSIKKSLIEMGFNTPTPIQEQSIPEALKGMDILGTAQTGTGKTGAFIIPMTEYLINNEEAMALILLPTRELASQVLDNVKKILSNNQDINTALLIGGDSMIKQLQQLKRKPRVIVGTPGRINDHIKNNGLKLGKVRFLVLDEMDRMLDMGFGVQIDTIIKITADNRQTLMFSATMPSEIKKVANKYLNNPVRIKIGEIGDVTENVTQENVKVSDDSKYDELVHQLGLYTGSKLVFVKTKYHAEKLAKKLNKEKFEAGAIHGDLRQNKRDRVIASFRNMKFDILVATDLASRGLDIPHIENVINYDLPQCPEDYIHRIGRTARAGASGRAINLLAPADNEKWRAIYRLISHHSSEDVDMEKAVTPVKKGKTSRQRTDGRRNDRMGGNGNSNGGNNGGRFSKSPKARFSDDEMTMEKKPRVRTTRKNDDEEMDFSSKKPRTRTFKKTEGDSFENRKPRGMSYKDAGMKRGESSKKVFKDTGFRKRKSTEIVEKSEFDSKGFDKGKPSKGFASRKPASRFMKTDRTDRSDRFENKERNNENSNSDEKKSKVTKSKFNRNQGSYNEFKVTKKPRNSRPNSNGGFRGRGR